MASGPVIVLPHDSDMVAHELLREFYDGVADGPRIVKQFYGFSVATKIAEIHRFAGAELYISVVYTDPKDSHWVRLEPNVRATRLVNNGDEIRGHAIAAVTKRGRPAWQLSKLTLDQFTISCGCIINVEPINQNYSFFGERPHYRATDYSFERTVTPAGQVRVLCFYSSPLSIRRFRVPLIIFGNPDYAMRLVGAAGEEGAFARAEVKRKVREGEETSESEAPELPVAREPDQPIPAAWLTLDPRPAGESSRAWLRNDWVARLLAVAPEEFHVLGARRAPNFEPTFSKTQIATLGNAGRLAKEIKGVPPADIAQRLLTALETFPGRETARRVAIDGASLGSKAFTAIGGDFIASGGPATIRVFPLRTRAGMFTLRSSVLAAIIERGLKDPTNWDVSDEAIREMEYAHDVNVQEGRMPHARFEGMWLTKNGRYLVVCIHMDEGNRVVTFPTLMNYFAASYLAYTRFYRLRSFKSETAVVAVNLKQFAVLKNGGRQISVYGFARAGPVIVHKLEVPEERRVLSLVINETHALYLSQAGFGAAKMFALALDPTLSRSDSDEVEEFAGRDTELAAADQWVAYMRADHDACKLWNPTTGSRRTVVFKAKAAVGSLELNATGQLAVLMRDSPEIHVYGVDHGALVTKTAYPGAAVMSFALGTYALVSVISDSSVTPAHKRAFVEFYSQTTADGRAALESQEAKPIVSSEDLYQVVSRYFAQEPPFAAPEPEPTPPTSPPEQVSAAPSSSAEQSSSAASSSSAAPEKPVEPQKPAEPTPPSESDSGTESASDIDVVADTPSTEQPIACDCSGLIASCARVWY